MRPMTETPFDSIESAQEFVRLLASEVQDALTSINDDMAEAAAERAARRLDALYLVDYKLKQLAQHLDSSSRILNDLRMLRRLLVADEDMVRADLPAD